MAGCDAVFTTASLCTTTNSIQPNEEATIVVSVTHCNADPRSDGFLENFDFSWLYDEKGAAVSKAALKEIVGDRFTDFVEQDATAAALL